MQRYSYKDHSADLKKIKRTQYQLLEHEMTQLTIFNQVDNYLHSIIIHP